MHPLIHHSQNSLKNNGIPLSVSTYFTPRHPPPDVQDVTLQMFELEMPTELHALVTLSLSLQEVAVNLRRKGHIQ